MGACLKPQSVHQQMRLLAPLSTGCRRRLHCLVSARCATCCVHLVACSSYNPGDAKQSLPWPCVGKRRGCHVVTSDVVSQVPEISEFEVRRHAAAGHKLPVCVQVPWCIDVHTLAMLKMHMLQMAAVQVGLASIFILHTSAGLTINENGTSGINPS
jgi:Uncharacterised protein family UPF0047